MSAHPAHAVTARAREAGAAEVLLFTDLSNPTSNSIYRAIGCLPVADYATVRFDRVIRPARRE